MILLYLLMLLRLLLNLLMNACDAMDLAAADRRLQVITRAGAPGRADAGPPGGVKGPARQGEDDSDGSGTAGPDSDDRPGSDDRGAGGGTGIGAAGTAGGGSTFGDKLGRPTTATSPATAAGQEPGTCFRFQL
jgi:hypothetical protein